MSNLSGRQERDLALRIKVGSMSERMGRSEVTILVMLVWMLSSVLSDPASCRCECRSWTRQGIGRPPEVVRSTPKICQTKEVRR